MSGEPLTFWVTLLGETPCSARWLTRNYFSTSMDIVKRIIFAEIHLKAHADT
jgi:hypothetical protein